MYNADGLLELLQRRPFTPIVIELATAVRIQVRHPEQAVVTATDDLILLQSRDRPGRPRFRLVGLDHVVSAEPIGT